MTIMTTTQHKAENPGQCGRRKASNSNLCRSRTSLFLQGRDILPVLALIQIIHLIHGAPHCYCHAFTTTTIGSLQLQHKRLSSLSPPSRHLSFHAEAGNHNNDNDNDNDCLSNNSHQATTKPTHKSAATLSPTPTTIATSPSSLSSSSTAAQWHRDRRQQMLAKYASQIQPLEQTANSQTLGLLLLAVANTTLFVVAILCGRLHSWPWTVLLGLCPGSIASLWQLQILHDNLHGCLFDKTRTSFLAGKISKRRLQQAVLFWGSMPSMFGYYLYLHYGHLTHHQAVGNPRAANLRRIFESSHPHLEDGDVLFVAHRMKLVGDIGPRFCVAGKEIILSISNLGFSNWKTGQAVWNMGVFAASFWIERLLLTINDVVVAVTGKNHFFGNKPPEFHRECARYCRAAVAMRALVWWLGGKSWHSLAFLFLSETLWSIPPHPASAMFVTNHGSKPNNNSSSKRSISASPPNACIPSSSTYAGTWYSVLTLGTNYHCEHHDFPTIPFQHLAKLRNIAPEYYSSNSRDRLWPIMVQAFANPDYYACMNDMESIQ